DRQPGLGGRAVVENARNAVGNGALHGPAIADRPQNAKVFAFAAVLPRFRHRLTHTRPVCVARLRGRTQPDHVMGRILTRLLLLSVLALGLGAGASSAQAQSHSRAEIEVLAEYYAAYYGVPITLVRRVINRESTFNPSARNGPYYGLMQILPQTAGQMGYRGPPEGLLNAETNLIHAVKYLRGAWLLAGGSESRAVQLYAAGYYYVARDAGM